MEMVLPFSCGQEQIHEAFQGTAGAGAAHGDPSKIAQNVIAQLGLSLRGGNPSNGASFGFGLCRCGPIETHVGQQEVGTGDHLEVSLHALRRSGLIVPQSQQLLGFLEEQLDGPALRIVFDQLAGRFALATETHVHPRSRTAFRTVALRK